MWIVVTPTAFGRRHCATPESRNDVLPQDIVEDLLLGRTVLELGYLPSIS